MNWKETLQLAWKNKGQIAEGFYNAFVSASPMVKKEAMVRLEICRSNTCGLYNPKGENTDTLKAVFPGKESCGGCGCDLYAKCHAMSAYCYLKDLQIRTLREKINDLNLPPDKVELINSLSDDAVWLLLLQMKSSGMELDLGKEPLWEEVMSHEQEMEINKIAYQRQFENRKK